MSSSRAESQEEIIDIPKICLIGCPGNVRRKLKDKGFQVTEGTLGIPVSVPNRKKRDGRPCLVNYIFPPNLHEHHIAIIDLKGDQKPVPYKPEDHSRVASIDSKQTFLLVQYPATLFDPQPLSASILEKNLKPITDKGVVIVFAAAFKRVEYTFCELKVDGFHIGKSQTLHNYSFTKGPLKNNFTFSCLRHSLH